MSIQKVIKKLAVSLLFAVGVLSFTMPAQAAMVATAQIVADASGQVFDQKVMQQQK